LAEGESLLRADTLRLEEHAGIVRREQRAAQLLVEQLCLAQRRALPGDAWRYDQLIGKAKTLERYFSGMAGQVDHIAFELARLSVEIGGMLTDAGSQLRNRQ